RRPPHPPLFPYTTLFRSEVDGAAQLQLPRAGRLERLVAERQLHRRTAHHGKRLVLGVKGGAQAGGPVRCAQLQLVDAVDVEVLRSEEHTSELQSRSDLVC